jgi:hypothetical protein
MWDGVGWPGGSSGGPIPQETRKVYVVTRIKLDALSL